MKLSVLHYGRHCTSDSAFGEVKLSVCLNNYHTTKTCEAVE